jgi:mRNA interferase MazF
MVAPAAGQIVLVRFPFSDLSQSKFRPAVCLVWAGRGDWVLCQITSNPYGDSRAVRLDDPDFATGGLKAASYARPGKLFTAHEGLIAGSVGKLRDESLRRVVDAIVTLLRSGAP